MPKLGKEQQKKTKVFVQVGIDFLRPNSLQVQSQSTHILIVNVKRGAIFAFSANIGLKSTENRVFCILCMPTWEL